MPSPHVDERVPRSPEALLAEVHRRAGARRRQRRRITLAASAAIVAAATVPFVLRVGGGDAQSVRVGDSTPTTVQRTMPTLPDGAPAFIATSGTDVLLLRTDGSGVARRIPLTPAHPGGTESIPALAVDPTADSTATTLVPVNFVAQHVQVSADGGTVYYLDNSAGGYCVELRAVAVDSGHAQTIVPTQSAYTVQSYDVSADGSTVVYSRQRSLCRNLGSPNEIVHRNIATGEERVLLTDHSLGHMGPVEVSISADGRNVAVNRTATAMWDTQVQVIDVDTAAVRTLPATPGCHYNLPRFTPSGDGLAVVEDCHGPDRLGAKPGTDAASEWMTTANRTGRLLLVDPATGEVRRTLIDPPEGVGFEWFRFDPSGQHLLYRLRLGSDREPNQRLSLATGKTQSLYPEPNPDSEMTITHDADW